MPVPGLAAPAERTVTNPSASAMLDLQAAPTVGIVRDPKERGCEEPIIEEIRIMKRILIALLAAVALCGVAAYSWADG
ncbi:MAG TPA: hypothetical protein VHT22_00160, partial [Casimicrobiaceae bacterium]|nr:hypothetical protein [Casimicrobiaceae bacterium]